MGLRAQFAALGQEHARLLERFELLREATSDGLWDVELAERKLTDPANEFIWSDQVRRLVGYRNEQDLPNGLGSWTRLLHPDDLQGAMAAFTAHVLDRTGRTPYDVTYACAAGAANTAGSARSATPSGRQGRAIPHWDSSGPLAVVHCRGGRGQWPRPRSHRACPP